MKPAPDERLRVLHVAPYLPGGPFGGQVRLEATRRVLCARYEVRGLYLSERGEVVDVNPAGASRRTPIPARELRPRWRSSIRSHDRFLRLAQTALLALGAPVSDCFVHSATLQRAVDSYLPWADAVVLEFSQLIGVKTSPKPTVVVFYDIIYQKLRRRLSAQGQELSLLERARGRFEQKTVRRHELAASRIYDSFVFVTEEDESSAITELAVPGRALRPRSAVSPNGVWTADYAGVPAPGRAELIGFIGSPLHPPNADAIRCIVEEIEPRLPPYVREIRLIGRGTERLSSGRVQGVGEVRWMPDALRAIDVTIAPIRWGSGSRLKILESLAAGRPVIAYPAAADGLAHIDDQHGLYRARNVHELVQRLDDLHSRPDLAAAAASAGRRLVASFDWSITLEPICREIDALGSSPAASHSGLHAE